jgi:hypothetical protein
MRQFIKDSYDSVMNARYNPLRHVPNQNVRHAIMLGLMWMWCALFAVWTGGMVFLGASIYFHSLLLFGVFVTVGTFDIAKRANKQPSTKN